MGKAGLVTSSPAQAGRSGEVDVGSAVEDERVEGERLARDFFARRALDVAPDLLGCLVSHAGVTLRLTEVEAYDGPGDPGSHAFRGVTPRTAVMFGPPGTLYVYFTYGMHWCANLVCGPDGTAGAVLLRAGEVIAGAHVAHVRRTARHRGRDGSAPAPASVPVAARDLARGPARLSQALALAKEQNGLDFCAPESPVRLCRPMRTDGGRGAAAVLRGPRVGVAGPGGDATAYPWRFWLEGEPTVSAYRVAKPRRRDGRP